MNPLLRVFWPLSTGALKHTLLTASFGLALFLPQAEAALFDFSYVYNGNTLQGIVDGTLLRG